MAEFPALPLWTDAYLADTTHLSYAESGLYLAVLMHMWRCPGCRIPNDKDWLMRKFRLCEADFANLLKILKEFCECDGNWWVQKRLLKEWAYCKKQSDSAKARWRKGKVLCQPHEVASCPTPTPHKNKNPLPSEETPTGVADDDLDALFYRRGKALLGRNAGGQLTRLRQSVGLGQALQIIDDAKRKESPAEYVAKCIRNRSNGDARNRKPSAVQDFYRLHTEGGPASSGPDPPFLEDQQKGRGRS